ncbi:MAG: xanthine dehydrogenase family protein [Xanthobacteraceae bacterium]|nr:xanthine dehydrogenase family protein [Xanthobacteraceae bacterium]MBX3533433.1 xanthine dehydrogenase family protein [Xanthobacteraceae bacterium]MCW5676373.1 xanthine dehydrogenase family protein [Xanthobacteraceae bacterium]
MTEVSNATGQGIGARLLRKEDARYLHGRGNFVADIDLPGLQEVAFLRSPVAHARLKSINVPADISDRTYAAKDLAGVKPVEAHSSIPKFKPSEYPAMATEKVRFVGELLAMCVAPSRAEAEDLVQRLSIDIEELPPVIDAVKARQRDSALLHEEWGDNIFLPTSININFDEYAKKADVVVKREYKLARQCMMPMEGKGVLAYWDEREEQLVVYASTQVPHMIRTGLSLALGLDQSLIRVVAPDVGGGFGYKCVLQPEEIAVAWLAMKRRHPVRWVEDRREHLTSGANAREHHYVVTAYADKRGKLLALDAEITVDVGAYAVWPWVCFEGPQAGGNLPGAYIFGGYRCQTYSMATNKPPLVPYRGVSRPGVCFAIEMTVDAVARAVGREPAEVRLENLVPASSMPYTNITNKHYDSGDYPSSLKSAIEKIDLAGVRARQKLPEPDGRLIGVGFAPYTEQTAHGTKVFAAWGIPLVPGFEQASVRLTPGGGLEIRVGVQSHGQGMETTLAQIANEILGIDVAKIRVVHGDTKFTPYSTGTYASRSIVMAGGAVSKTCTLLGERMKRIGAHLMQCKTEEVKLDQDKMRGPTGQVSVREIADVWYLHPEQLPDDVDPGGLEATGGYKPKVDTGAFTFGTHAAVVAVDPELGSVEILDYVIIEDCGSLVNPMVVEGQTYGGAAQGIGTALYEEMPYDQAGQPLASNLADYLVPGAAEVPQLRIFHTQTPSPFTEHGIKGVGEGGAIAPSGAIVSAINDALRPLGAEVNSIPATPRRVLTAIEVAKARSAKQ